MTNPCGTGFAAVPAPPGARVDYRLPARHTYLYCNNPEQLRSARDLGDRDLGNAFLLWAQADGRCLTWYGHLNRTGRAIGYGVQLRNPHGRPVLVEVTRLGFGTDPFAPWLQFFGAGATGGGRPGGPQGGGGGLGAFLVPPGGVRWIQRHDGAVADGQAFSGVAAFRVRGGGACVFWYAYERFDRIGPCPRYRGWVRVVDPPPFPQDEARVYKGVALRRGSCAPGAYRVLARLDGRLSRLLRRPAAWASHWCPSGEDDVMDLLVPTRGPRRPRFARASCLSAVPANLGNWGVIYDYRLRVVNDDGAPRRVHLLVSQLGAGAVSNVTVAAPDGVGGCSIGSGPGAAGPTWDFYDFALAPGESRRVRWQLVLGAGSGGHLTNGVAAV